MKSENCFQACQPAARKRKGFTLMELLTVMAIAVILLLAAVPALKSIQGSSMQVAARQVCNDLQLARQYAITRRNPVRFIIALQAPMITSGSSGSTITTNDDLICRGYNIVEAVSDSDGNILYWQPLMDWRLLPVGVVFSDLATQFYDSQTITLTDDTVPKLGAALRYTNSPPSNNGQWQYFDVVVPTGITNLGGGSAGILTSWVSKVEFRPTGYLSTDSLTGSGGSGAGAIRLVLGSVLDPTTRNMLVTDTNNWVYIEYDKYSGKIRARYRDSYTFQ